MGTYNLPRSVKGEGRILFIFSTKALIYSAVGLAAGLIFYLIFKLIGISFVGVLIMLLLALVGFVVGTMKMPDTTAFEITKKTGGENIDDVITRLIKFKMQKKRIYVYKTEELTEDKGETRNEQ